MPYTEKEELAKTYYLTTDKTQKEICMLIECSQKTFLTWKKKGNWNKRNSVKMFSQGQVIDLQKG